MMAIMESVNLGYWAFNQDFPPEFLQIQSIYIILVSSKGLAWMLLGTACILARHRLLCRATASAALGADGAL